VAGDTRPASASRTRWSRAAIWSSRGPVVTEVSSSVAGSPLPIVTMRKVGKALMSAVRAL
jgi:hypothetical protein